MILNILDKNRQLIDIIRTYESCLWTKKYQDVGGCVLVLAPTTELVDMFLNEAKYISRDDDSMVCEIKQISVAMDNVSYTYKLTITALGCEIALNQRIVWNQTTHISTAEMYMRRIVLDNIVEPTITARKVNFIKLGEVKGFTELITKQVTYDELLPVIIEICKTYNLGFHFIMDESKNLLLEFYRGSKRDITFSKQFNNLLSFDWELDLSTYKNVALVGGEGEGVERKRVVVGSASGINRYETFTDANGVSSEGDTVAEYNDALEEAGRNDLAAKTTTQKLGCKIDNEQYEYRVDFDLGDTVEVEAEFGLKFDVKIIEVIECNDANGYRVTVTLEL